MNERAQSALTILSRHQWIINLSDEIVARAPQNVVNDPQRLVQHWLGVIALPDWWCERYEALLLQLVEKNLP